MHLAEATTTDAADLDTDLACLPVGSTEQHGPHLAMGTDTYAAEAVASAGAEAYDGEVAVAPPVTVGISEEHRDFAGSLWVSPDTFRAYVRETIASLAHSGFDRVVVVNGHGGNTDALRETCARVTRDETAYAVPFTWFDAVGVDDLGHGGPVETSLVWHHRQDLVREDRFEAAAPGADATFGEWVAGTNLACDFAEFTESGNLGDPAEADPDRGEALLAAAAEALCDLLTAVADRERDVD
ncbi:MAG: creatininase family protein [Haloarculaceae archaeon]